ncbi:sugar phosphate isomerase/epimerase [Limisphaera ngatamarikiensis]|uniref:Sugar phosphate isomerase/epimerase n=1 Tax=Limisphaera ngatamarikiensis TaxID=1324935 RepID=A0A6M1RSF9_9BACT|nr:TIM barrel protein [Limisphaera ngatamarikiensis]NGO38271.1 sugar phosphate isomerase/epimerase [Limisphaera ngatamarikiensis]
MERQSNRPRRLSRRTFLQTTLAATAAVGGAVPLLNLQAAQPATRPRLKLGFDNFAVRAMGWKAPRLLEYAATLKVDSLFISDLDAFESHDTAYLRELRARAQDLGVALYLGTWSICPTSRAFRDRWGTAEEHLSLGIRMASDLGSPVLRVVLGTMEDRRTPGGIRARIADTVRVLKACRSRALDAGIRIAVENHAGDMQAHELAELVEDAGTDFVGVNFDSGNACWTLEDPLRSFAVLGRYTLCTSLRDAMVWEYERGAKVQWTAMGEGCLDLKTFFDRFAETCPEVPVHIETISGFAREFPYLEPEFWEAYPTARAADFAAFLALAKRGRPLPSRRFANAEEERAYQRDELERSLRYCREVLGLGRRS